MGNSKYEERVQLLKRVEQFELEGRFDEDTSVDPPAPTLEPDDIDYLREKLSSKWVKTPVAMFLGKLYFKNSAKEKQIIIKDVIGLENLENIETGGIITSNHFNPFEAFAVEKVFLESSLGKKHKLYAVIREGNYTNFPGLYGFLFKNCNTLPLSSNHQTMKKFYDAVKTLLNRGDFILIYPEQSMWWNYRKPKPLKDGAYRFACRNNVPIIPFFITTRDSDILDDAGFPILEYYVHIGKPIYKDKNLTDKENIQNMRKENFLVWKKVYEAFYNIPLEYTCDKNKLPDYILESLENKDI